MEWQQILQKIRNIKNNFNKSYKSLNIDIPIKEETLNKHIEILLNSLEEIRDVLNVNYNRLTSAHKVVADAFFLDIRDKLIKIASRNGKELVYQTHCTNQFPAEETQVLTPYKYLQQCLKQP